MSLRRACVVAAVGFGLPLTIVAAPAQAATTSTSATSQCQTLLGCVVPIIGTVPQVLNAVPQVLSNLLGTKHTTPVKTHKPPVKKPHHGKAVVKNPHQHSTPATSPAKTAPVRTPAIARTTPAVAPRTVTPPAPAKHTNPFVQAAQEVARVAKKVVTLFGWNLLALIPMVGIAVGIARRMTSARRSGSGLL